MSKLRAVLFDIDDTLYSTTEFADHARGNRELQRELREIFKTKTCAEWIEFSNTQNTPIAPVNTPKTIAKDPQFQHRLPWYPASKHGADMLPFPVKFMASNGMISMPTAFATLASRSCKIGRSFSTRIVMVFTTLASNPP